MLISAEVMSQSSSVPFYYKIGEEDFANVNVFSIIYDEEEEILFAATNNGVYYHTQSKFHKIPTPTEALGQSFFNLQFDQKKDLFVMNLQGQVFEVTLDKLDLIIEYPQEKVIGTFDYNFSEDNNIICAGIDMVEYIRRDEKIIGSKTIDTNTQSLYNFYPLSSGGYLFGVNEETYKKKKLQNEGSKNLFVDGRYVFELDSFLVSINSRTTNYRNAHLDIINRGGQILQRINMDKYQSHYDILTDSTIIAMDMQNGMNILKRKGTHLEFGQKLFDQEFISCAYQSGSGVLFLGTFKEGIIIVPKIEFIGNEGSNLLTSIRIYNENKYVVSGRNGSITGYEKNGSDGELIASHNEHLDEVFILESKWDDGTKWGRILQLKRKSARNSIDLGRGDYAYIEWNGIRICTLSKKKSHFTNSGLHQLSNNSAYVLRSDGRYKCITADTSNKYIYASKLGELFKIKYPESTSESLLENKKISITSLLFEENTLYCGDDESGILILKNDQIAGRITFSEGLSDSGIKRLMKKDSQLFILSNDGLQIYDLETKQFKQFGVIANILDRKVIDFDISGSHITLLRKKDHYSVPLEALYEKKSPSRIYIDSCTVNGVKIDFKKNQFSFDENSIIFFVDYRDFTTKRKTTIQYKLEGFYDDWRDLKKGEHEIIFQSLPAGKYTMRIQAEFEGQHSNQFVYYFEISPPFWQTWWFYSLIVLITIISIGGFALLRLKRIRFKAKQHLELQTSKAIALNAQLKAIRAQMNPHFMFNSINSIQDLVLQKETIKSYDYLESFSRLVRMTLEHSEREFVSLIEENEFLNLYLDLESLRFDEEFEFNLSLPEELQKITVPSLIVQPFVENAIKHGLLHKTGKKKLEVIFSRKNEDKILCVITDNGIGRERAGEISNRRHKTHASFSTGAIQARLQMINDQLGANFYYEIIDLNDPEGNPSGTRVEITFPIISIT